MTTSTCPPPEGGTPGGRGTARVSLAAVATLSGLFLAACGGDDDYPNPPPPPPPVAVTQVPASAAATDASLESFAFNLALSDTTEPLTLELVPTFPTSETEEPIATP